MEWLFAVISFQPPLKGIGVVIAIGIYEGITEFFFVSPFNFLLIYLESFSNFSVNYLDSAFAAISYSAINL
jgi:hypothetical protein